VRVCVVYCAADLAPLPGGYFIPCKRLNTEY
jgi:hypothetical protein